jgi:putative ATP-binding cassette transporter
MPISAILNRAYSYVSWPPLTIGRKTYNVIKDIDKTGVFLKHLVIQTLFALSSNYILFNLRNNIMQGFGNLDSYVFSTLPSENATEQDWEDFKAQGLNVLPPVFTYIGVSLVVNSIERLYENWVAKKIKQELNKKVFNDDQIGIHLANSEKTAEIVRNLPHDIDHVTTEGLRLVKDAAKTVQNASLSILTIYRLSNPISIFGIRVPDLLFISVAYSAVKQMLSSFITNKTTKLSSEFTMQDAKTNTIMAHDFSNVKPIFTASAQNAVSARHAALMDKTDIARIKYEFVSSVHSIWLSLTGYANSIFKYVIAGHKVYTKAIKREQIYETFSHISHVDDCVSWVDENQKQIKELEPRLDRLQILLNERETISKKPVAIKYLSEGHNIVLSDIVLKNDQNNASPLLKIEKLTIKPGERIVISGASGSGKSSLVAKINRIIHDGIEGAGKVVYPSNMSRMMLTQDDYFPAHSSLLDIICLPGKPPIDKGEKSELVGKINSLLREAKFGREVDLLEEKTNWSAELSGGQKKKLKIISAIHHNPDFLLLDEVFVGIDKESVAICQDMIQKYIKTIAAVDHHPNESRKFYTSNYEVRQGKLYHRWGENGLGDGRER